MKNFVNKITVLMVLVLLTGLFFFGAAPGVMAEDTDSSKPDSPVVALALSSGAAWGLAHLGVIEVLEEHDIDIKIITGTSAGAIVGSLYADGMSTGDMRTEIDKLGWTDFLFPSLNNKGLGFFTTNRIENYLSELYQNENIEDLNRTLAITATDIDTGQPVTFTEGPMARIVSASVAVPVLFDPVDIDDYWLADGGLVRNLPVDEAKVLGADIIIAVDVATGFSFTGRPQGRIEYGNRAYNILRGALQRPEGYDILIEPDLNGLQGFDFEAHEEIINRGRQAAEKSLEEIKELIDKASSRNGSH